MTQNERAATLTVRLLQPPSAVERKARCRPEWVVVLAARLGLRRQQPGKFAPNKAAQIEDQQVGDDNHQDRVDPCRRMVKAPDQRFPAATE